MRARRPGDSGPPVADFPARRAAAYQAFYEHMPVRAAVLTQAFAGLAAGAEVRLYSQQRFGRLATIVLLDDRQYRDPQVCSRGGKLGLEPGRPCGLRRPGTIPGAPCWAPRRSAGSTAQLARAGAGLDRHRPADPVRPARPPARSRPVAVERRLGRLRRGARAPGAVAAAQRANPVLLGGDVHENWVGHVKADYSRPDSPAIGVEFCGTSITSRSDGKGRLAERLAENPHFVFADAERKGYGVAEFTPRRLDHDAARGRRRDAQGHADRDAGAVRGRGRASAIGDDVTRVRRLRLRCLPLST